MKAVPAVPASPELELAFIGAALMSEPQHVDDVVRQVDDACFTRPTLAKAWQSIVRHFAEGRVPDPISVATDVAGGEDIMPSLDWVLRAATGASVGPWFLRPRAEALLNLKARRELVDFGATTARDASSVEDLRGVLAHTREWVSLMDDMQAREETGEIGPIADRVEARAERGAIQGWATGVACYDEWSHGLHRSRVHVIAGTTGAGKTWLATQLANAMVSHGELVLVFSLEMHTDAMYPRIMAGRIGFRAFRLMGENRTWSPDAWEQYRGERERMEQHMRLYTCKRIDDIAAHVRAERPAAFVVDYVQLMADPAGTRFGYEAQTANANMLLDLCHKSDSAMILVSQMGREAIRAGLGSAVIGARDSGRWDEIAELFVQVSTGETYTDETGTQRASIRLDCRKNRHGPTGGFAITKLDRESGRLVPR